MPHLLIIRGLPGSGKTSLAQRLGLPFFEADQFMLNEAGDYAYDAGRLAECHRRCLEAVKAWLESGGDCVVANVFSQRWQIAPYAALPFPHTVIRCEGRFTNVHAVPEAIIRQIADRWEDWPE